MGIAMSCAFDTTKCAEVLEIPKTARCNEDELHLTQALYTCQHTTHS